MSAKPHPAQGSASDHEIIKPPIRLDKFVIAKGAGGVDFDAISRAEKALAALSENFDDWMLDELDALSTARDRIKTSGLSADNIDRLFHTAHDIKGQATTLGYPLAADAASSLCYLLEHAPQADRIPLLLIDQHVEAVRAIVREHVRARDHDMASALTRRLAEVTVDFVDQEAARRA